MNKLSRTFECGWVFLANSSEICYTYDSLGRVTSRAIDAGAVDECGNEVVVTENYSYDAAGNLTSAPDTTFAYGTNNRLTQFNGSSVSYDLDGNRKCNFSKSRSRFFRRIEANILT